MHKRRGQPMWFEEITGFKELSKEQVHENLHVNEGILTSKMNNKKWHCGRLEIPSLAELRVSLQRIQKPAGKLSVREEVGDTQKLHADIENAGALFQVASQFNLLEMPSPSVTPEKGVTNYVTDQTQGPACAIAAGAGTIYRNYFARVNGNVGQTSDNQIDCLSDLGKELGNTNNRLWTMQNGYALATESGLVDISNRLESANELEIDHLRGLLRIGLQNNTQVTMQHKTHLVTQAYCSALPVAYSDHTSPLWEPFAKLILEASYEATLSASVLNTLATGNNKVFLTLIGGGVFGNNSEWILQAIKRALVLFENIDLDVVIVSHRQSNPQVQQLVNS